MNPPFHFKNMQERCPSRRKIFKSDSVYNGPDTKTKRKRKTNR